MPVFTTSQLVRIGTEMFRAVGVPEDQARITAEVLVAANVHGVDSHGVSRIPGYVRSVKSGRVSPSVSIRVLKETPTTATWDCTGGFGQVYARMAMEEAIRKAESCSIGLVGTLGRGHIGALYYYSMMAVRRGMIGIVTGRSVARQVVPYGGAAGRLGTNPIAIGIPAGGERPILLDMATSIVAGGHAEVMATRGQKAPEDWFIEPDGTPTKDPNAYSKRKGTMVPFGTYKGYGLCLVLDAIGMALGATISGDTGFGHTFMAIDPNGLVPLQDFGARIDELVRYVKSCPPQTGFSEIIVPGELEFREEEKRSREGVFVDDQFWEDMVKTGGEVGVDVAELVKS